MLKIAGHVNNSTKLVKLIERTKTNPRKYNSYSIIKEYERWNIIRTIIRIPDDFAEIRTGNMI